MKHKVSERQLKCLEVLAESEYDGEPNVVFFDDIAKQTGLPKNQVRVSVRALARKGLVELSRGLIKEEDPGYYGSGYRATQEGLLVVRACKECGFRVADMDDDTCPKVYKSTQP
jgi:DNA-binding IclR family transcriptional regulator